jgi:outer membrane protein OmpA-like peptidoglycan-associated protein
MWAANLSKKIRVVRRSTAKAGIPSAILGLSILLTPVSQANTIGSDTQNFNTNGMYTDFITVHSSKTLGKRAFNLGLSVNYSTNTLPYFEDATQETVDDSGRDYNNAITGADVTLGVGVLENLDLGITLPYVLHQHVSGYGYRGQFRDNGLTEVRVMSKYRLWNNDHFGLAVVASANINQMENNPYTGEDGGPIYNGELVFDTTYKPVTFGVNVGYRWRKAGDVVPAEDGATVVEPFENQLIASTAVGYDLTEKTTAVIEIYGNNTKSDLEEESFRKPSTAEAIAGAKYKISGDWIANFGVGSELRHSFSSADLRVFAGINWQPKSKESHSPDIVPMEEQAVPTSTPDKHLVVNDVFFAFNSADLSHETAGKNLKGLSEIVTSPRKIRAIIIEGHTCEIGTASYNQKLSQQRALAIKNWLVSVHKIDARKIIPIGLGEAKPLGDNKTPEGRKINRRVEFKVFFESEDRVADKK